MNLFAGQEFSSIEGEETNFGSLVAGAYTLTGKAITKGVARATAQGSFVLTGKTTTQGISRATAQGSFALTGKLTTQAISRATAQGSYVLTGKPTTRGILMGVAQGSYVLTGNAVTLTWHVVVHLILTALQGTYALTGTATTGTFFRDFGEQAGAWIMGCFGDVDWGEVRKPGRPTTTLTAAQGSYALTGLAAVLFKSRIILNFLGAVATGPYAKQRKQAPSLQAARAKGPSLGKLRKVQYVLQQMRVLPPSLED